MAETHRYTLIKPARLLFSSITAEERSAQCRQRRRRNSRAPSGSSRRISKRSSKSWSGDHGGNRRLHQSRRLFPRLPERQDGRQSGDAESRVGLLAAGLGRNEEIQDPREGGSRRKLYEPYAGILTASSQYDVELARLEGGKIIDIPAEEHAARRPARIFSILAPMSCRRWPSRASGARRSMRRTAAPPTCKTAFSSARASALQAPADRRITKCSAPMPDIPISIRLANAPAERGSGGIAAQRFDNDLFLHCSSAFPETIMLAVGTRKNKRTRTLTTNGALKLAYRLMALARGGETQGFERFDG
jgi:hypothetical protein